MSSIIDVDLMLLSKFQHALTCTISATGIIKQTAVRAQNKLKVLRKKLHAHNNFTYSSDSTQTATSNASNACTDQTVPILQNT